VSIRTTLNNWTGNAAKTPPSGAPATGISPGGEETGMSERVQRMQAQLDALEAEVAELRGALVELQSSSSPQSPRRISSIPPPPLSEDQAREFLAAMNAIVDHPPDASARPRRPARRSSIPRLTLGEK